MILILWYWYCSLSLLTLRYGLSAGSGWPHLVSVTTERSQTGDDGRFAEAHVAHDHHAPTSWCVASAKTSVHLLEEPLPAGEQPIRRETRNLKVEGLQVERGSETNCRKGGDERRVVISACKRVVFMFVWKYVCVYLCGPVDYDPQNSAWAFWGTSWMGCVSAAHPDRLDLRGGQN